jgi:undecaprenyl-diphosphatase
MIAWDHELLHRINTEWTHPVLDWLMPAVSAISVWTPRLVVWSLLVIWRGGQRGRLMVVCVVLSVVLGDCVVSNIVKRMTSRQRPRDVLGSVIVRDLGRSTPEFTRLFKAPVQKQGQLRPSTLGKSFPSSHAVNMFSAATVVALFWRRWGMVAFVLASMVAYSRVYCGAHWPSDIPPSLCLGVLLGWGTVTLARFGGDALGKRWIPSVCRRSRAPSHGFVQSVGCKERQSAYVPVS